MKHITLKTKIDHSPSCKEFPENWQNLETGNSQFYRYSVTAINHNADEVYGWSDSIEKIKRSLEGMSDVTIWDNNENELVTI